MHHNASVVRLIPGVLQHPEVFSAFAKIEEICSGSICRSKKCCRFLRNLHHLEVFSCGNGIHVEEALPLHSHANINSRYMWRVEDVDVNVVEEA